MKTLASLFSRLGPNAVILVMLLALGVPKGLGQESEDLKRRFNEEAPSRWEEYVRLSGELQGILTISHTATLNAFNEQSRIEYKTNGRGKLLKVIGKQLVKGNVEWDGEEVFGVNPRYAFSLERKSPNSPWLLTNLIKVRNSTDLGKVTSRFNHYLRGVTYALYLDGEPLSEVVHKPEFRIGHCCMAQVDGEELMEVEFTYSKKDRKWNRYLQGKLLFDPNRYWCLRSGEIQISGNFASGTEKFQVTQSDNAGGLPPLSRAYQSDGDSVFSSGDKSHHSIRFGVSLSQPTRLPADEEFTLTAFGLHEPLGIHKKTTRWYLWVALASFICLVLAALFRWKARRVGPAPGSPQPEEM